MRFRGSRRREDRRARLVHPRNRTCPVFPPPRSRRDEEREGRGRGARRFREVDRAIDSSLLLCFLIAERDPRMTARRFSTGRAGD